MKERVNGKSMSITQYSYIPTVNTSALCHNKTDLRERSGSVVECLTRDRRAVGSSLTGITVLCP